MGYSNTLSHMIKEGLGYRNISDSSDVRNLKSIIEYEYIELGNSDIFDFLNNNFDDYHMVEGRKNKIDYTLNFIAKKYFNDDKYNGNLKGIWLTTYQGVIDIYCNNDNNEIYEFYIHENKMFPISDLGYDGALFVYKEDIECKLVEDKGE